VRFPARASVPESAATCIWGSLEKQSALSLQSSQKNSSETQTIQLRFATEALENEGQTSESGDPRGKARCVLFDTPQKTSGALSSPGSCAGKRDTMQLGLSTLSNRAFPRASSRIAEHGERAQGKSTGKEHGERARGKSTGKEHRDKTDQVEIAFVIST